MQKVSRRIISGILFYFSLLLLSVLLFLQFSFVQTFIAKKVLNSISTYTDHEISLDRIRVSWLDNAEFQGLLIYDTKKDTMIYAESISVNYKIMDLIRGKYLQIEEVASDNLFLNLVKYDSVTELNLTGFLQSITIPSSPDSDSSKTSSTISVEHILLEELSFRLTDKTKNRRINKVDFSHLNLKIPLVDLTDFQLGSDTIIGNLNHFEGKELNSGFAIEALETVFRVSSKSLSLHHLDLKTASSTITDSLEFSYTGLNDFSSFTDSVSFVFRFKESKISKRDIQLIMGINQLKSDIFLNGFFEGTVGDFYVEDARIGLGSSTYWQGEISCFGLPDLKRTFILADIVDSHLVPADLEPYIGKMTENLRRMGKIDFNGSFAGFLNDFVAKGDFKTDQGSVYSDINLKIPDDPSEMSYNGNLELDNVNIGAFLKNDFIQSINLVANIEGNGITPDNADFNLRATLLHSGLMGYIYDSLSVNGYFKKNFFKGEITIEDPNCKLRGNTEIDLRGDNQFLDVDIVTRKLLMDTLNLTNRNISAIGHIDLSIQNFDMDDLVGDLKIDSAILKLDDKIIPLNSVKFSASFDKDSIRNIFLGFPGVRSEISGDFKLSDIVADFPLLVKGYAKKLQIADAVGVDSLLLPGSGEKYRIKANVELLDVSSYLDSLQLPVSISKGSILEMSYRQGKSSNISIYYRGDSLRIDGNTFKNLILEINGSSTPSSGNVLTNFIFRSTSQNLQGIPETNDLLLEGVWYDQLINLSLLLKQPSSSTDITIESQIILSQDSVVFKVLPSNIIILNDQWSFNLSNNITFKSGDIMLKNFEIYDQSESIRVSGIVSDNKNTSVNITIEDLNMDKANLFSEIKFDGFLNGSFDFFRDHVDQPMRYDGGFFLKNLKYDNILLGDLDGSSRWEPSTRSIYSTMEVKRDDFKSVQIKGYYFPAKSYDQLDFDIDFNQADLSIARPFVEKNISDMKGTASGQLKLLGSISKPEIIGDFSVENGSGRVLYLNTPYSFSGRINFDPQNIGFTQFDLIDRKGAVANLYGQISHDYFSNFVADLSLAFQNFEFLNTTLPDNKLYYGSAYVSGKLDILGPLNDLFIKADVKTEPNTRFFIPVSESTSPGQEEFIQFVDFSDTISFIDDKDKGVAISGITLDFDIEITPDAYCELIFDIKKGDIIRGRGRGNLKLSLSSDGEFSMFGPLDITEGAYNFTLSNLINKEFEIVPGSRITWYGDPYDAQLNLEATYLQRASFEELESSSERDEAEMSNKVPILVVLNIDGSIVTPNIGFDLRLENESDANTQNEGKLSRIRNDEQELRRQFISLLFLKRFSPYESFSLGSGQGISGSVSEILSNQLSYLISQIDENLEIEVDLAALNDESFNTFQLRFAYTFLDGRLKVTRGGGFGNDQDVNQNVLNNIVGDWSVEYSLTRDGRLRAKVFRNTNEQLLNTDDSLSQETGISLRFVHSFNDLTELLTSKRNEAIRRRKKEKEKNAAANNDSNLDSSTN
ncbi:MAG: translocation/assembly module TamB domain-containing protein [Bacteroidota bacterium]